MKRIETTIEDGIGYLDLNIPPVNVLGIEDLEELTQLLRQSTTKVVALRSKAKLFSAGFEVKDHLPDRVEKMLAVFTELAMEILRYPGVTASVVQRGAHGGAMELALCTDILCAAEDAVFAQPEIKLGVFPPLACALYPLWFPRAMLNQLLFSGEPLPARELQAHGIVSRLFPADRLWPEAHSYLKNFTRWSKVGLSLTKRSLTFDLEAMRNRLESANRLYREELMKSYDALEGLQAFLEKREARWKDA